jgi:thiol-disulfide isomerase/thioredoxin
MMRKILFSFMLIALSPGAIAEGWSLKDSSGASYKLSSLHGKWVLVNFWAPWCPPCIKEIPDLVSLKNRRDLQVIGVAVMYKSRSEVMEKAKSLSIPYPIVLGNEDTAGDFGGISGLPTTFLYAPTGQLVGKHEGPLTKEEIDQAIEGKAANIFTR